MLPRSARDHGRSRQRAQIAEGHIPTANSPTCEVLRKEVRNKKAGTVASTVQLSHLSRAPNAPNQVAGEASQPTLMAKANEPTERGKTLKNKKKRKKSKPKSRSTSRHSMPSRPTSAASNAPDSAAPAQQRPRRKSVTVRPAGEPVRDTESAGKSNKNFINVDLALDILGDVLKALRTGADPVAVILSGMASLFQQRQCK